MSVGTASYSFELVAQNAIHAIIVNGISQLSSESMARCFDEKLKISSPLGPHEHESIATVHVL